MAGPEKKTFRLKPPENFIVAVSFSRSDPEKQVRKERNLRIDGCNPKKPTLQPYRNRIWSLKKQVVACLKRKSFG